MRLTLADAKRLGIKIAPPPPKNPRLAAKRRTQRLPDEVLWEAISPHYLDAVREYQGAVPGRRFRIDIAMPSIRIALEVDGWQFHGKHRKAHQSDRDRQNLLVVHGWMVLRFTAGQIFKDMAGVLATIDAACRLRATAAPHQSATP